MKINMLKAFGVLAFSATLLNAQDKIVHDAEYLIIEHQNKDKWNQEDQAIDKKLADMEKKNGQRPNIVYVLWDDQQFGAVGFPEIQKTLGYHTPNMNQMADEGINFTRMYSEPACTPTRAAFLTGRHPVRNGMGVVGMPHEFSGMRGDEVTIAEVLSEEGYATAHFGKGHLGDVEESYLHNQGFDEALFTPMNQITSLYNPQANAANAVLGLYPEQSPADPYKLDQTGLLPNGWVMILDGKKGQQAEEWCGLSNDCYEKMEAESEKRTLDFIRRNAKADKPFFVEYWPNFLNFLLPQPKKSSLNGGKVPNAYTRLDNFIGDLMQTLKDEGVAENTLVVIMADNGPMVHNPPAGWGMTEILFTGGKGDFTEGGIRVPAIAWWPGTIAPDQLVGDMIHVTDLYTTFARIGGATEHIPTDRVIDGVDQTALFMNGDTHGRRDFNFVYQGHTLAAVIKGRYKFHLLSNDPGAATGIGASFYDLYQDPKEHNPHLVPLIHTQGQFKRMIFRHELMKQKFPDKDNARGVPLTGISNARPETKAIKDQLEEYIKLFPFDITEYVKYNDPDIHVDGDWGN